MAAGEAQQVRLLTTPEVQRLIRVDRSTIYRMAEDGRLPAVKVGRQWRFPEDRLRDWLRAQGAAAGGSPAPTGLQACLTPGALQAVADLLGEAMGVMVLITDLEGRPLTTPSNPCGLFEAAHRYAGVLDRCIDSWRTLAAELDLDAQWRATPFGFLCARSLIRQGGRLVGMVVAGGLEPPSWPPAPDQAAALAEGLGVPAAVITEHAAEVHRLDARERERVLLLLPRSAAFLSRLAAERSELVGRLDAIAALAADSSQRSEP